MEVSGLNFMVQNCLRMVGFSHIATLITHLDCFNSVSASFIDNRTGRNIQHAMHTLLRQSIYSRLAGYEDVNDAEQLSIDPVMRAITGKKDKVKQAASANTVGRFETDILTQRENLKNLFKLYKYHNLNLLSELLGVISPHVFDMGDSDLWNYFSFAEEYIL
jgi:hypothetical protein